MPFSHNGLKTTTGIYRFTAVNRFTGDTLAYRFLNGNVHGCVFAKNRPVSLNWSDYTLNTGTCIFLFGPIYNCCGGGPGSSVWIK